ncbi:unnamed protein product [Blepharisma stoltei]|uniref:Uncharacterized protein n=1 Tax=Blepharisma stoltei TaxID=1481888 RepID=A0AAU9IKK8_9CILI|nr:unnamed protein product [Blepharisma stoltei]
MDFNYEMKIKKLSKLLALPEKVLLANKSANDSKERKGLENYVEAIEKCNEIEKRNKKLTEKLEKIEKEIKALEMRKAENEEKYKERIQNLSRNMKSMESGFNDSNLLETERLVSDKLKEAECIQEMLVKSHNDVIGRARDIFNLKTTMQNQSSDIYYLLETKRDAKSEVYSEFNTRFLEIENNNRFFLENVKCEYEEKIELLSKDINDFIIESKRYFRSKDELIKKMEKESTELFLNFQNQDKLIRDVENGNFNGGIKPIFLLENEIPKYPQREKFPLLFKALASNKLLTAKRDNNYIQLTNNLFTKKYIENTLAKKRSTTADRLNRTAPIRSSSVAKCKNDSMNNAASPVNKSCIKENALLSPIAGIGKSLQEAIIKKQKEIKKIYSNQEQDLKTLEKLGEVLNQVIKERDSNRELYKKEIKHKNDTKIVIDSQKRLLENYFFLTEQGGQQAPSPKVRSRASSKQNKTMIVDSKDLSFDKNPSFVLQAEVPSNNKKY